MAKVLQETDNVTMYFDPRKIRFSKKVLGREGRFNPRTLNNPGFQPERMEDLQRGIKKDGLNSALLVQLSDDDDAPDLVAGERRLRAILDLLRQDAEALDKINAGEKDVSRVLVKNQRNRKMEPALDVYGERGVECKIIDGASEKERLRQAVQENTLHEPLTDYELLLQCDQMERVGMTRAEQAETTGFSEAWISQSHSLLAAPECVLQQMERGLLCRTAALSFLDVAEEKIEATLSRAMDITYKEASQKELQVIGELEQAQQEMQQGAAQARYAVFIGDHESIRKSNRQVARASKVADKAEKKLEQLKAKKKKRITSEVIKEAAKEVGADADIHKPQSMKHIRLIEGEIGTIISSSEDETILNPANNKELERKHIIALRCVLEWVLGRGEYQHPLDIIPGIYGEPVKKNKKK
jgi:hypothetical protein